MPAFRDKLKSIFGWGSSRPSLISKAKTDREEAQFANAQSSPGEYYHNEMDFSRQKRRDRYDVYDAMDQMSDISSVLDAYAEDATQIDYKTKETVWVEAKDKKVEKEANLLLHDILDIDGMLEGIARDTGKDGDDFAVVQANPKDGVTNLMWRDPRDLERIENLDGILVGFEETARMGKYRQKISIDLQNGGTGASVKPTYNPWDVIHFRIYRRKRLPGQKAKNIYGTSLLAGSERIAKQVKILDDMLMIMRVTRGLDRNIYYVDVGRSPVEEELRILKRWRRALKRRQYMDPTTGRFDSRFDPTAWTDDVFWPVKENNNSRVETQEGITNISEIADIDHFRDKLFGSLRAPKGWFGYEGDEDTRKNSLASQSVKWARAVFSLQRAIRQGLKRLVQVHLAYRGLDTNAENFEVMMTIPSLVELIERLEAWQQIIDVAERMAGLGETLELDKVSWTKHILTSVLWLPKEDVNFYIKKLQQEPEEPRQEPTEEPKEPPQAKPPADADDQQKAKPKPTKPPEEVFGGNGRMSLIEIDQAIRHVAGEFSSSTPGAAPHELPPHEPPN